MNKQFFINTGVHKKPFLFVQPQNSTLKAFVFPECKIFNHGIQVSLLGPVKRCFSQDRALDCPKNTLFYTCTKFSHSIPHSILQWSIWIMSSYDTTKIVFSNPLKTSKTGQKLPYQDIVFII